VPSTMEQLRERLLDASNIRSAAAVLRWDQTTYMPPGGAPARARQIATLGRIAHERFTDPEIGRMLDELRPYEESLPYEHDDRALIRITRRDYERSVKVPAPFMATMMSHTAATYDVWGRARPDNDFAMVASNLEKTLDLSRQLADFFPGYTHIADPMIDFSDYGMDAETIRSVFGRLRAELVPLVRRIADAGEVDDRCLRQEFPIDRQLAFGETVVRDLGYDFERGRIDLTLHPFMTKFSLGDVRITTRVDERDFGQALFSSMHEAGHAMYEQGVDRSFEGSPLAGGASSGVHESQSRLWENVVGRSPGFWLNYYPRLQAAFPEQFNAVPRDEFVRAINRVTPSLIRTDADEVTYNLHVMIRFDLELAMLEGRLSIADLPEAWRERYTQDLGVTPEDDKDGVLQDVHWFGGLIGGAFQGYTLGNIMGAQFYEAAVSAHPEIPGQIEVGEFDTLRGWLVDNLYRHGRKFTAQELLERATGSPLTIEPYMRYLHGKYGALYSL
jgi:carboxypeptidase Taq